MLNTAIGKLYRHLQLSSKEQENTMVSDHSHKEGSVQKENVNILTLSQMQPDETFHDIVLKLRNFEKEFQRQKVQQQREQMRFVNYYKCSTNIDKNIEVYKYCIRFELSRLQGLRLRNYVKTIWSAHQKLIVAILTHSITFDCIA
jgi:hypothetical protein